MASFKSLSYLRECLRYDPVTGSLHWRTDRPRAHFSSDRVRNRWLGIHADKPITCVAPNGYIVFNIDKKMYAAHRVIYAMLNDIEMAELPEQIDHRDTDRTNNVESNLRAADASTNQQNRSLSKTSTSGLKGVSWGKQRKNGGPQSASAASKSIWVSLIALKMRTRPMLPQQMTISDNLRGQHDLSGTRRQRRAEGGHRLRRGRHENQRPL